LRHHAHNTKLPHVQYVEGNDVVELLAVRCQAPYGTNRWYECQGTVLRPEVVAQGRSRVPVAGERTFQLSIQYGGHVTKRRTDTRGSTSHMAPDSAVRAEELTCTSHQAHDRPLRKLVGHDADQKRHSCQRLTPRKLHGDASLACSNELAEEDREAPLQ